MAAQEEARENSQVIKGKRTKRLRPISPLTATASSSSGEPITANNNNSSSSNSVIRGVSPSLTNLSDKASEIVVANTSMTEEEDMANCLILLSRSQKIQFSPNNTSDGFRCKTCDKSFNSFQALGGHRASHKKPKNGKPAEQETKDLAAGKHEERLGGGEEGGEFNTTLSLEMSSRASYGYNTNSVKLEKVHECSICGAEFSSGQALGGHMRRHRPITTNLTTATTVLSIGTSGSSRSQETKKRRNDILQLDLNLPAPEDDILQEAKFSFTAKEQTLVFSAPLVDCHY